jgi:SsrA-binding protein
LDAQQTQGIIVTAQQPASSGTRQREVKVVVENRQARHLYHIEDTFEAGLILEGWEVKAILAGHATFNGGASYVELRDGEAYVELLTITPLAHTSQGLLAEHQPARARKLLLNKSELRKLERRKQEQGYTIVPLSMTYGRKIKLNIGLAKGKKLADKRETVKARDNDRQLQRELKSIR